MWGGNSWITPNNKLGEELTIKQSIVHRLSWSNWNPTSICLRPRLFASFIICRACLQLPLNWFLWISKVKVRSRHVVDLQLRLVVAGLAVYHVERPTYHGLRAGSSVYNLFLTGWLGFTCRLPQWNWSNAHLSGENLRIGRLQGRTRPSLYIVFVVSCYNVAMRVVATTTAVDFQLL